MRGLLAALIGIPAGFGLAALSLAPAMPLLDLSTATVPYHLVLPPAPAMIAAATAPNLPVVFPHARPPSLDAPPPGTTSQASGAGFFVSANGAVLTAAHVVTGCRAIRLLSRFIAPTDADLVAIDPENDVALLQAHDVTVPAQLAIGPPAPASGQLFVLGYPANAQRDVPNETWASLVNHSFAHTAPLETDPRILLWMQNRDIAHGYSGGPIVDPNTGRVAGIVRALIDGPRAASAYGIAMPNLSIGSGATPLQAMLASATDQDGPVPAGDAALDVARKATVHVVCWQ